MAAIIRGLRRKRLLLMSFPRSLLLAVPVVLILSACSASTGMPTASGQMAQLQQASVESSGQSSSGDTHYLYVTAQNASGPLNGSKLFVFALPLTASSKPIATVSGFYYPTGVAVGDTNIVVADNAGGKLLFYYRSGASAYALRCSVTYGPAGTGPFGVALAGTNLFVTDGQTQRVSEFANGDGSGTPLPCSSERPVSNVANGISMPDAVAANDTFVYVGNRSTMTAYAQPFGREAPAVTLPDGADAVNFVLTSSELYVMNYYSARIDEYTLPLTSDSAPIASARLPECSGKEQSGFGLAVYPSPPSGAAATELFATGICHDIYVYHLPLTSGSTPTVETPTPGFYPLAMATR
jgi:hypothetical protein